MHELAFCVCLAHVLICVWVCAWFACMCCALCLCFARGLCITMRLSACGPLVYVYFAHGCLCVFCVCVLFNLCVFCVCCVFVCCVFFVCVVFCVCLFCACLCLHVCLCVGGLVVVCGSGLRFECVLCRC